MDSDALGLFLKDLFIPGTSLAEKIIRPVAVYIFLVVILRVGGRRELSQMNAFDLVVLLMLANAVQNAIIGDDSSLMGGFIGGATLILLNLGVIRFLYRHPGLDRKIEGEPVLLLVNGRPIPAALEGELVPEDDLLAVVHRQGVDSFDDCAKVILETSGTITVLARQPSAEDLLTGDIMARLVRIERLLNERVSGDGAAGEPPPARKAERDVETG